MRGGKSLALFGISFILFLSALSFSSAGYIYCNDSDGGINYFVYGNVGTSYTSVPMESQITRTYDVCEQYSSPTVGCTGETCYIREYYCGGPYLNELNYSSATCYSLGYSSCADGECYGTYPTPPTASCSDGIKNRDESDIDCGGVYCSKCTAGKICYTSADCLSTICSSGVCYESPAETVSLDVNKGGGDPGNHQWQDASGENVMMQLRVSATESVLLDEIKFSTSGTGNEINIVSLTIYLDQGILGKFDNSDIYIGSTSLLSDNTDLTIDMTDYPVYEVPRYFIAVYRMVIGTQIGTYSLKFEELTGVEENNLSNIISVERNYENTKTVFSSYSSGHCANGVIDTSLGETGIDCGGGCPTCPPSYNPETPDCLPPSISCPSDLYPLCNPMNGLVYACISGVLTSVPIDYSMICLGNCINGEAMCNYYDSSYSICERGIWSFPYYNIDDFYSYCGGGEQECDPMYDTLECYDGIPYRCNELGMYEYDEPADQSNYCGDFYMCNPGEVFCSYEPEFVSICTEWGWWEAYDSTGNLITIDVIEEQSEDSFFNSYCGDPGFPNLGFNPFVCNNDGERRCNPIVRLMEVCDGSWTIIPGSEQEYNQTCQDAECNSGWFKCNPAEKEVSFCQDKMWGTGITSNYDDYCMPDDVTLGRAPQTIVGEVINNTIIVHEFLPSEPVLIEKNVFGKPIYWILGGAGVVVLIILISLIVHFATKYSAIKKMSSPKKSVKK